MLQTLRNAVCSTEKASLYDTMSYETKSSAAGNSLFEGGKIDLLSSLSERLQVSHNLLLGGGSFPNFYQLNTTLAGPRSLLQLSVDSTKGVHSKAIGTVGNFFSIRKQFLYSPKSGTYFQGEADFLTSAGTLSFKLIDPKARERSGIFVVSGVARLTRSIEVGMEKLYSFSLSERTEYASSYSARLSAGIGTLSMLVQNMSVATLGLFRAVSEHAAVFGEVTAVGRERGVEVQGSIGSKVQGPGVTTKVQLFSSGKTGTTVDVNISTGVTLNLSADIDHLKERNKFGMGVTVDN